MTLVRLADVAFARPGDKGDISDVTVFARSAAVHAALADQLTVDRVAALYGDLVSGPVARYEVPLVWAWKFVMERALGGGGPASLRADNLGKAMGGAILRLQVDVPAALLSEVGTRPAPARDPYAAADWVVRRPLRARTMDAGPEPRDARPGARPPSPIAE